jgi:phosphatidylserine decarboxylase
VSFAREGYPFMSISVVLSAAAWAAALGMGGLWMNGLAVICSVLVLFVVWFFRDPAPRLPADGRLVVAPGQGKVIDIREVDEPSFLRGAARRITIFLSVFDVHVQRAPVSGTVEHRSYKAGEYAVAWLEKASEDNEQASLGITTPHGRVLVRQIAGLVARRIVTDPVEGDTVERGHRIGLIRFGSRVDLFLPLEWEVTCAVGDKARVGVTALARLPVAVEV